MRKIVLHTLVIALLFSVLAPMSASAVVYDMENEKAVYAYLTEEMGLNKALTAAIMANIDHESRFDPQAGFDDVNGMTSYGICQWNGSRFEALKAFCEEQELDYTTLEGQLAYLQFELEGEERRAYEKIRYVPDTVDGAYEAGYNWAKYYERCMQYWDGVDQFDSRGIQAENYYWYQNPDIPTVFVRFDHNGGSCQRWDKRVEQGTAVGRLPVPVKENAEFLGWYCDGVLLTEETVLSEDVDAVAMWKELEPTPTPVVTATPTPVVTVPPTPVVTATPTPVVTATPTPVVTATPTPVVTAAPTPVVTATPTPVVTATPTPVVTATPTPVVTAAPTPVVTATPTPIPEADSGFVDVSVSDYFYEAVKWAVKAGITSGTGENTFSPELSCTRGQIVTFLWRAYGSPEPTVGNNPFMDVSPVDYYYKPVLWAVEKGITAGTTSTTFSPEQMCTRGQIVMILWKAVGCPTADDAVNAFADVSPEDYFYHAVRWAVEQGITSGTSADTFSPEMVCTRGQVATMLWRAIGGTELLNERELAVLDSCYDSAVYFLDNVVTVTVDGKEHAVGKEIVSFLFGSLFG